jgi:general secretion pathway protein D
MKLRVFLRSAALVAIVLGACASAPEAVPRNVREMIAAGQYEAGIEHLNAMLEREPRNAEVRILLMNTRIQLANRFLANAAHAQAHEDWQLAEEMNKQALALGANEAASLALRNLATAKRQSQLFQTVSEAWAANDLPKTRLLLRAFLNEYPKNAKATMLLERVAEKENAAREQVRQNESYQKKINLQFRDAPVRSVFEAVSASSGLNFTFDKDVPQDVRVTVFLKNTTVDAAIRTILLTSRLEQRVLDDNTLLIYQGEQAKKREYQQLSIRSFHVANAEAKQVANSLKTILKARDIVVDEKLNMIVMRDTPETIRMAEQLVSLHDVADPEVMLEVEVLEIQRSHLEELGVKWPGSVTLSPLATTTTDSSGSTTTSSFTLKDLKRLNSSKVGATVESMVLSASQTKANGSVLANPRIRIKSREKALIKVGQRVPSLTATTTSTGVTSSSVNYIDVGLKLEAEPTVYLDDEISIKLNLEVSSILGTIYDSNNQPSGYRIGSRNASTVLRLKDGENQVLAGLISDEDKYTASAVPVLGELPILDRLFGSKGVDKSKTEIVLSITPRLIRNQKRPIGGSALFDGGTDAELRGANSSGSAEPVSGNVPVQQPAESRAATSGERSGKTE